MGNHMSGAVREAETTGGAEKGATAISVAAFPQRNEGKRHNLPDCDGEEFLTPYMQQIVCVLDGDARCRQLTANWQHITGHANLLSLGPQFLKYFHPSHRKRIINKLASVTSTGMQRDICTKCQLRHADGSWRWIEICVAAARSKSGDDAVAATAAGDMEYICTLTDITKYVETERKLQRAKLRAELAMKGREDFLANMSHELRTPLNAILGFTQMMEKQVHGRISNPKYIDYINNIQESGHALLSKINDLLAISNLNSDDVTLAEQEIELEALLKDVIEHRSHRAFRKHVSIRLSLPKRSISVRGDKILLQQAMSNLLGNAIKYSGSNGRVSITARRDRENGGVRISFADNGSGIKPERIKRLRQLMAKKEMQTSAEDERVLSLMLANEFIRRHGGSLNISSKEDKGTIVVVNLPASRLLQAGRQQEKNTSKKEPA